MDNNKDLHHVLNVQNSLVALNIFFFFDRRYRFLFFKSKCGNCYGITEQLVQVCLSVVVVFFKSGVLANRQQNIKKYMFN